MLGDYIGLRERGERGKKETGESMVAGPPCGTLRLHMAPASASVGAAGVPRLKFHSQVAHRAELVAAGTCGLCPPAPSRQPHSMLAPSGCPKLQRPGREAAGEGRAALCVLGELLSCLKSSAFQSRADPA